MTAPPGRPVQPEPYLRGCHWPADVGIPYPRCDPGPEGWRLPADTRAAFRVEESRHEPVWYFPPEDVNARLLAPTETTTYCPFNGHASYWTIDAEGERSPDAVWAYLAPYDECRALAGYYAFYPDRVRLEVGGEVQRPL